MTSVLNERHARLDWLHLAAIGSLMLIGVAFVFSATTSHDTASATPWYSQVWFRQIVWGVAGLSAAAVVCFVD